MASPSGSSSAARLHAAVHWRICAPFFPDDALEYRIEALASLLGRQAHLCRENTGFEAEALVVCSTVLSGAVNVEPANVSLFCSTIERIAGLRPAGIANVYMCTGWGFALRHFTAHTRVRRLAIAIADVDVHNLQWHLAHPVIGRSGFGVTCLFLELPEERSLRPTCSGPHPNSAFNDFALALKAHQALHGARMTFLPFINDALFQPLKRVVAPGYLGPNKMATYGHCFGADPWIGLIEHLDGQAASELRSAVLGAIAFNGYYTLAEIALAPSAWLRMEHIPPEALRGAATLASH
ncbi:hypothetical protein [Pseudorhodoferax sp. Leaf274]|uniref:hypothetical protein n=1 Tax=Pseudorhodoferax sp. Leaf274 TaxID=1736318 RepID=UPI0007028815|nr:hypothetical protein [Pseudorhodoferax sp. Leaf274]KQP41148.1 hypothetical protein ASF44_30365 [Pseudorhodoferax sp. Leaf274]